MRLPARDSQGDTGIHGALAGTGHLKMRCALVYLLRSVIEASKHPRKFILFYVIDFNMACEIND